MESIMKLPDDIYSQDLLPFLTAHDIAMLHVWITNIDLNHQRR